MLSEIVDWFYAEIVSFLANFFSVMGNMGVELFELPWVIAVVDFFTQLGWSLFGVALVVSVFECGIEYSAGRGNIQGTALNALKGLFAVNLFSSVPIRLYALSVSLQDTLGAAITGASAMSIGSVGQEILADFTTAEGLSESLDSFAFGFGMITSPFLILFSIILMAYAVLKVFFANLKRGGILLIQIAVGSRYMFSIPRGYTDGFTQWIKQVVGLCLTAFLQSTILIAGLMAFRDRPLLGLGLMLSAGEVPRIAGVFGLDTSTKANLSGAVYTAQSAVNVARAVAGMVR